MAILKDIYVYKYFKYCVFCYIFEFCKFHESLITLRNSNTEAYNSHGVHSTNNSF